MKSTWQKLVGMWSVHKRRFICAIFCFVFVLGAGIQVAPVSAIQECPDGVTIVQDDESCPEVTGTADTANPGQEKGAAAAEPVKAEGADLYDMALTLAARMFDAVFEIAFKIVSLLIWILISIVQYDTFSDNAAIKVGWPIVRNVINMFVILGLLFIAIKNLIPGQGDNGTTQNQLFKVLLAVVLMNFSQTIALLAVDFSQVVTITFAQAISDIGSGNFIQLFGLQNYLTLAPDANESIGSSGSQAAILLGTVLFKLVMIGAVGLAILVMIVAFVVRIVLLWFLIIISPAAFFAFGLGGAVPMLGGVWKQWSDQFMGLLVFGPVLTFFLWLALAIAAGGDMAATLDFEVDPAVPSAGLLASAGPASILSTVLAIIMIFIGIAVSAQVASSSLGVGAVMSKGSEMTRNFIQRNAKRAALGTMYAGAGGLAAGAVATLGAAGAVVGGTASGIRAYRAGETSASGLAKQIGMGALGATPVGALGAGAFMASRVRTEAGVNAAQSAVRGIDGALAWGQNIPVIGRAAAGLRQATSAGSKALGGIGDQRMQDAEARMKDRDSTSLHNDLGLAQGVLSSQWSTPEQIADSRAVMKKFLTDKEFASSYKKEHGEDAFNARAHEAFDVADDSFFDYLDDKDKKSAKEALYKFKVGNLHLMQEKNADGTYSQNLDRGAIQKLLNDGDFKKSMLSSDTLFEKQGADTVTRDGIWSILAEMDEVVGYDDDGNPKMVSMARQLRDGRDGTKKIQAGLVSARGGGLQAREYVDQLETAARSRGRANTPPAPPDIIVNGALNPDAVSVTTPEQVRAAIENQQLAAANIDEEVLDQYADAVVGAVIGASAAIDVNQLSENIRTRIGREIADSQEELEQRIQAEQGGVVAPDQATELTNMRRARLRLHQDTGANQAMGEAVYLDPATAGAFRSPELRTEFSSEMTRDFTSARHVSTGSITGELAEDLQRTFDAQQTAIQQQAVRAMRARDQAAIANIRDSLERYRASISQSAALAGDAAGQSSRLDSVSRIERVLSATPSGPPPPVPPVPPPTPPPAGGARRRRVRRTP